MVVIVGAFALAILALVHTVAHVAGRFAAARALGVGGVQLFSSRFVTRGAPNGTPAPFARRAGVSLAGFGANYLLAMLIAFLGFLIHGEPRTDTASMRVTVAPGGPADEAGMRDGDRITSAAGDEVGDWDTLKRVVAAHAEPIDVGFTRDGAERHARVTRDATGRIRVQPFTEIMHPSVGAALARAIEMPPDVLGTAAMGFVHMFTGREKPELTGPLGITKEVGSAKTAFLSMLAMLSAYYLPLFAFVALLAFPRARRSPAPPPA